MQPGQAVAGGVGGERVGVGGGEGLAGVVVEADHGGDGDLAGRDPVGVLEVLDRLDRRLPHLAAARDDDADAARRAAEVHRHQVDDVVLEAGAEDRLDDLAAEGVDAAVAAVGCGQGGEGERELDVGVLRLGSGGGGDEVLDVGLGLAAFDVEVDAGQVRAGVAGDERFHARRGGAGEGAGLAAGRDHVVQAGAVELRDVLGRPGGGRGTAPGLAAAGAGGERERDRGQLRDVGRYHAAGAHHRDGGPFHGRLHLVGVPVHVDGDVLVRAEEQAAHRAGARPAATAAATAAPAPAASRGAAGAGAVGRPRLSRAAAAVAGRRVVALRPPVGGVIDPVLAGLIARGVDRGGTPGRGAGGGGLGGGA